MDVSIPRQHFNELKRGHYIKLPTYVADFKGFAPFAQDLKTKVLTFHKRHRVVAKWLYKTMLERAKKELFQENQEVQNFTTTVSIHIRLTDFGSHLERLFNVTYAPPAYFSSAMQYFTDRYKVFSYYYLRFLLLLNILLLK